MKLSSRGVAPVLWLGLLLCAAAGTVAQAAERVLTVFAAASLTNVMQGVGDAYTAQTHQAVRFSFAASSALARQIESGAPADVFVSADQEWMDYLQSRQLIEPATRANVVANTLVLIAPAGSRAEVRLSSGAALPAALLAALGPDGRLATGDPAAVPVGRYAHAALLQLGAWQVVEKRIVAADNVRTALNFVARGEAPLGIVYGTDARSEPQVRVVDRFPPGSHEPISYPAAAVHGAAPEAADFVAFLQGPAARALFDQAGFGTP